MTCQLVLLGDVDDDDPEIFRIDFELNCPGLVPSVFKEKSYGVWLRTPFATLACASFTEGYVNFDWDSIWSLSPSSWSLVEAPTPTPC